MNESGSPDSGHKQRVEAVSRKRQLVKLVGACLGLLFGVVFCHQFSAYQVQNFFYGAGIPASHLPAICRWFAFQTTWLLVLPPAILLVGTRRLLRERTASVYLEVLQLVTVLLAVVLVLGCILAWQVPYAVPVGEAF